MNMRMYCLMVLMVVEVLSKVSKVEVSISRIIKRKAVYLAKFKFKPNGIFRIGYKLKSMHKTKGDISGRGFELGIYDHNGYNAMEQLDTCTTKREKALKSLNLSLEHSESSQFLSHLFKDQSSANSGFIFFFLLDCEEVAKEIRSEYVGLDVLLDFRNGDSHHEAGEEDLSQIYIVVAFIFLAIFLFQFKQFYREISNKNGEETNYAYVIVNVSLILKIASLVIDITELQMISWNGSAFFFFNFVSQTLNHMSQYLVTILLILLARGWTILFNSIDEFELFLPISILIGVFKVIIIGLGKMEDNKAVFFHRYDSFIGWILVLFNLGLYIYFIEGAIMSSKAICRSSKNFGFFVNLSIFGSIYFFLFPFLMVISILLEPERRSNVIELGRIISQLLALWYMVYSTGSEKGTYRKLFKMQEELPGRAKDS